MNPDNSELTHFIEPGPDLMPQEVVRSQLEALQHNDEGYPDRGIAIAYDFASPGNKQTTGPLERFSELVKSPIYRPFIQARAVNYSPMSVMGNQAHQIVQVEAADGEVAYYYFMLSRQQEAPCLGWWMTETVLRIG
jgi:hypothetical protein